MDLHGKGKVLDLVFVGLDMIHHACWTIISTYQTDMIEILKRSNVHRPVAWQSNPSLNHSCVKKELLFFEHVNEFFCPQNVQMFKLYIFFNVFTYIVKISFHKLYRNLKL